MANFLGFKQVKLSDYLLLSDAEKKNYMWLVREFNAEGTEVVGSAIYFGTRKYAEVNATDASLTGKVENLIESLGTMIDENGEFVGFLPTDDNILATATTVTEALEVLASAIKESKDAAEAAQTAAEAAQDAADAAQTAADDAQDAADAAEAAAVSAQTTANAAVAAAEAAQSTADDAAAAAVAAQASADAAKAAVSALTAEVASADEVNEAIEGLDEKIDDVYSALTESVATKANAADVYTKDEVDGKIAGVWHFKGEVASIDELPADAANGDVYQIGEVEYAFNGEDWVKLGFTLDLSEYASKDEVAAVTSAATAAHASINADMAIVSSALTAEIAARQNADNATDEKIAALENADKEMDEKVADLENKSTKSIENYSEAIATTGLTRGQIIILNENEDVDPEGDGSAVTYYAGAYIVNSIKEDGTPELMKLQASEASSVSADEKIAALSSSLDAAKDRIKELEDDLTHTVSGTDVEE